MTRWVRFRFEANFDDSRPVKWPPIGPWWETGWACDDSHSTCVAYLPEKEKHRLKEFWPEANNIQEEDPVKEILYTSRFLCPDWWNRDKNEVSDEYKNKWKSNNEN